MLLQLQLPKQQGLTSHRQLGSLQCARVAGEEQLQERLCCVRIHELLDGEGQLADPFRLDGVHAAPAALRVVQQSMCQLQPPLARAL